jgi:hypothetical protein
MTLVRDECNAMKISIRLPCSSNMSIIMYSTCYDDHVTNEKGISSAFIVEVVRNNLTRN